MALESVPISPWLSCQKSQYCFVVCIIVFVFYNFKKLFIYLAALGLSGGMGNL